MAKSDYTTYPAGKTDGCGSYPDRDIYLSLSSLRIS